MSGPALYWPRLMRHDSAMLVKAHAVPLRLPRVPFKLRRDGGQCDLQGRTGG